MDTEELISVIKQHATPHFMKSLLIYQRSHFFNYHSVKICIEGRASGNFRISTSPFNGQPAIYILRMQRFEEHPLKVNQWK